MEKHLESHSLEGKMHPAQVSNIFLGYFIDLSSYIKLSKFD